MEVHSWGMKAVSQIKSLNGSFHSLNIVRTINCRNLMCKMRKIRRTVLRMFADKHLGKRPRGHPGHGQENNHRLNHMENVLCGELGG